jgi:hypothetical protein
VLRRDWLANTKFAGKEDISGTTFNKFVWPEEELEYWETTDSRRIPRRMIQESTITTDYIMNTFTEEEIADSIFALPSYCGSSFCPAAS